MFTKVSAVALVLLACVVALVSAQGKPCCTPTQWEGFSGSWDPDQKFVAWLAHHYDYTNKRARVDIKGADRHRKEHDMSIISRFDLGFEYEVVKGFCRKRALNTTMEQACVPDNARFVEGITIGGELAANVFSDNGDDFHLEVAVSASHCVPIYDVIHTSQHGTDLNNYVDITPGIKDPSVFNVPSFCMHAPEIDVFHHGARPAYYNARQ